LADQKEATSLQHKWNSILARAGLSVYAGTNHRLVYIRCPLDLAGESKHERCFVKYGDSSSTENNMYLQTAICGLTKRDRLFLDRYASMTSTELAGLYRCSAHAIYVKASRIRKKLRETAKLLASM
jgi:hypothetical protein